MQVVVLLVLLLLIVLHTKILLMILLSLLLLPRLLGMEQTEIWIRHTMFMSFWGLANWSCRSLGLLTCWLLVAVAAAARRMLAAVVQVVG
jgi:hypothetical protein